MRYPLVWSPSYRIFPNRCDYHKQSHALSSKKRNQRKLIDYCTIQKLINCLSMNDENVMIFNQIYHMFWLYLNNWYVDRKTNVSSTLRRKLIPNPLYLNKISTVGENIIATIKIRNNFCYPFKMVIFPILR